MASASAMPILDEATFQQILEAVFVIQQQEKLRPVTRGKPDPAATLAEIADTQELLRSQHYDLHAAASLIAERLQKVTSATGIAIAVIKNDHLEYCAATGSAAPLAGSRAPIDPGLSQFLEEEQGLHHFQNSFQTAAELRQSEGARSPLLIPLYHDAKIAGLLQLSFPPTEPIEEHEIRSCQLMAGLMGEAIAREAGQQWKQSLAAERATMLEALEKLRPQLERLAVETPGEAEAGAETSDQLSEHIAPLSELASPVAGADAAVMSSTCAQCGYQFGEGEMFCGRCGTPRAMDLAPFSQMEWQFPQTADTESASTVDPELSTKTERPKTDFDAAEFPVAAEDLPTPPSPIDETTLPPALQEVFAQFTDAESNTPDVAATEGSAALALEPRSMEPVPGPAEAEDKHKLELVAQPEKSATPSPWTSAIRARKWLESLQTDASRSRVWLAGHRADLWVAVSIAVLIVALSGWGMHSYPSAVSRPSLTLFERMLVGLGLAEPPPLPVYQGNPNVQVWVDLHTALYYCQGSPLYGKTPGGKFTTQRDAQLDQFEPAARRVCQ